MSASVRRLFDDVDLEGATSESSIPLSELDEGDHWEPIDDDDIAEGDRLLVRADEAIAVEGTLVAVAPRAPEGDAADSESAGDSPAVTLENEAGDHRKAEVGESVTEADILRGGSAVVCVRRERGFPLIPGLMAGLTLTRPSMSQVLVLIVMILVALSGTGLGAYNPVDDFTRRNSDSIEEIVGSDGRIDGQGPVPEPDPVTVTPPPPASSDGDGQDNEDDESEQPPPTSTETPEETATLTPTPTPTATPTTTTPTVMTDSPTTTPGQPGGTNGGTGGGAGSGNAGGIGGDPPVNADLSVQATDPSDVRTSDGRVGTVEGRVGGSLSWTGQVTGVVLVVQTYVPGMGWTEARRVTLDGSGPVALEAEIGRLVYADGARSDAFANDQEGTTVNRGGSVSVTAVLFRGQREVARVSARGDYTFSVTNVAPLDLELGTGEESVEIFDFGPGSGGGSTGSDAALVRPGMSGQTEVPLTNEGSLSGILTLSSVSYESYENGQTSPEAAVDPSGGDPGAGAGELEEALSVRAVVEYPNGTRRDVIGDNDTYRSIAALETATVELGHLDPGESLTLIVDFTVPPSVGNEIQSDTLVVDFSFTLVER